MGGEGGGSDQAAKGTGLKCTDRASGAQLCSLCLAQAPANIGSDSITSSLSPAHLTPAHPSIVMSWSECKMPPTGSWVYTLGPQVVALFGELVEHSRHGSS